MAIGAALVVAGCKPQPKSVRDSGSETPANGVGPSVHQPPGSAFEGSPQTIDKEVVAGPNMIVSKSDVRVNNVPSCAMTVRYAGETEQLVTWNGEFCDDLTTAFVDIDRMRSMRWIEKLSDDVRDDVDRRQDGKTLYVEGKFTAAIYPLNAARLIYEIPVAD